MRTLDVVRSPRGVAGLLLLALALAVLVSGLAVRSGTRPGPDPWLVTALAGAACCLVAAEVLERRRMLVALATLRRRPGLPALLDARQVTGEPMGSTAWEDPRVRTAWRALARRALWPLLAALALASAVALPLHSHATSDADLAANGVRTVGQVVESGWAYEGRGGRPVVRVTYPQAGGSFSATVAGPPPAAAEPGTLLPVRVDAQHPGSVRAEGYPGTSSALEWWTTLGGLGVVVLLAVAVGRLGAALGWRAALRRAPWLRAHLDAVHEGSSQATLVTTSAVCTVAHGLRRRSEPAEDLPDRAEVGLLPGVGRALLVALPDGALVPLRLPSTVAEARRWLRALEPAVASDPQVDLTEPVARAAVSGG